MFNQAFNNQEQNYNAYRLAVRREEEKEIASCLIEVCAPVQSYLRHVRLAHRKQTEDRRLPPLTSHILHTSYIVVSKKYPDTELKTLDIICFATNFFYYDDRERASSE
jgi:hypothetical protein